MQKQKSLAGPLCILVITMLILLVGSSGSAEGTRILDYSNDLELFCHSIAEINRVPEQSDSGRIMKTAQYIVMCKTNGGTLSFEETEPVQVITGPDNRYILVYSTPDKVTEAIVWLRQQKNVLYAEQDSQVEACSAEESAVSFRSEGAERINLGGYLLLAQGYGSGAQTVAVIDSGVSTHSVLRGRMPTYGYDYVDADDDPTNDLSGHGTHVAGIIADCTEGTPVRIYPTLTMQYRQLYGARSQFRQMQMLSRLILRQGN